MKTRLAICLFFIAAIQHLHAVNRNWTNTLGGDWSVAANWSPNGVPTGGDVANITNGGTYTVTIATGTISIASLQSWRREWNPDAGFAVRRIRSQLPALFEQNGVFDMRSGSLRGTLVVQSQAASCSSTRRRTSFWTR